MELTIEELEPSDSIAMSFEEDVPDDAMVINVKLNFDIVETDEEGENVIAELPLTDIKLYIESFAGKILFSSAGIHLAGKSKKPHLHYNFITGPFKALSNPSTTKRRWIEKNDMVNPMFKKCTFEFHRSMDELNPKYSVLSYPLKEGRGIKKNAKSVYVYNNGPMTKEQKTFLLETGQAIYQKNLGLKLRQDKCEERKKVALMELYEICFNNKDKFSNYRQMTVWLDDGYIAKLTLGEYPDPQNYKVNCQKIAVNLGKLKYSDLV